MTQMTSLLAVATYCFYWLMDSNISQGGGLICKTKLPMQKLELSGEHNYRILQY